ncbi:MAG: hypothetical protein K6G60_10560 [Lachnospiraceae bacterium]|nr:hypothetical protein [Lachnospiraceae bacterium]
MYHIRLIKGLSYNGVVNATSADPDVYTEDEATANAAVASGFFTLVGNGSSSANTVISTEEETTEEVEETTPAYSGKTLEEMTVAELETFATYNDVSLKGIKGKAKMIEKLRKVLPEEVTTGEVEYGSPTMQELQEK